MSAHVQERNRARKLAPFLVLTGILAAVVVAVLVANGGGGESSGGPASPGGGSAGVAQATALAQKATTRPTSIGLTTPIGKPVPAGKKVAFISCGVEACEIQGDVIKQGAADLGWTASTIGTDGSPEQLQNAFKTAMRQGADAVILNAVNRASVAKQIEKAEQEGVAFVTASSVEKTGDGILANIADTKNSGKIVVLLAPRPLASTLFRSTTLYVNI